MVTTSPFFLRFKLALRRWVGLRTAFPDLGSAQYLVYLVCCGICIHPYQLMAMPHMQTWHLKDYAELASWCNNGTVSNRFNAADLELRSVSLSFISILYNNRLYSGHL